MKCIHRAAGAILRGRKHVSQRAHRWWDWLGAWSNRYTTMEDTWERTHGVVRSGGTWQMIWLLICHYRSSRTKSSLLIFCSEFMFFDIYMVFFDQKIIFDAFLDPVWSLSRNIWPCMLCCVCIFAKIAEISWFTIGCAVVTTNISWLLTFWYILFLFHDLVRISSFQRCIFRVKQLGGWWVR